MSGSFDVLLLHHPTTNVHRPIRAAAVGLLGMADHLHRHGIRVQVVNLAIEQSVAPQFDVVEYAATTGARIVGISAHWFFQLNDSLDLARALKQRAPEAVLVLGGFAASHFAADIVRDHPAVDVVIRGDAEVPLLELCRAVLDPDTDTWERVPNLVYRGADAAVATTPFTHVMDEALFGELRFMNLSLLKSFAARKALYYPTKTFRHRFDFDAQGVLSLAPTRGCTYHCALCGGNAAAQRTIFGRHGVTFQPIDAVLADLRLALDHGFSNFYLCSDPEPNGPYYFDLFRRIREERLQVGALFETWSLPSRAFVDAFAATFARGLLILSPDSADEAIRRAVKGPLAYTNDELADRVAYIGARGLACQLFFGFFLPGDTSESVLRTRRFVHDYESESCEPLYLAFSTDPCTPVALAPERYDMVVEVRELRDYLAYLPRRRLSPNLLAHRPRALSAAEADRLVAIVNYDLLLHKLLPWTLAYLRTVCPDRERYHDTVEAVLDELAAAAGATGAGHVVRQARRVLATAATAAGAARTALLEILEYEATPYLLMEEHFEGVGMHYTSTCHDVTQDEAGLARLRARPEVVARRHRFRLDVPAVIAALAGRQPPPVAERPSTVEFLIERGGTFAALRVDDE